MTSEETAEAVASIAVLAADIEAMNPAPVSSVPDPDGSRQRETHAEFTRRIVRAAILHLIEQGLVVCPDDIERRLEQPIPMARTR